MELRKYAADTLFIFPLVADGAVDFVTDYTPASGDAKIWTDQLIFTTLSAETVAFTSGGTAAIVQGDTITGATSTKTADVVAVVVTSGTWAGGDAAGFLFVKNASGAFQAENLNTGTQSNIATIAGDLASTLQPVEIGNGLFACAATAAEMTCAQGAIHIVDSATKAIEDQAIRFQTYGNASAQHAVDLDDSVRAGLSALPNAAADGAGGLPISDAGGLDMDAILVDTNSLNDTKIPQTLNLTASGNIGIDWANVENPTTAVDLSATDIQLVDTVTANTDMRGTDSAALASVCTEGRLAELDAANLPTDIATIDSNVDTLITNVPDVLSLANINAEVDTGWTTKMADSVSTDGTIATREQALYMALQFLTEFAISGTTYTVKKVDGSTTLFTLTLDDGTNPTSITRAT